MNRIKFIITQFRRFVNAKLQKNIELGKTGEIGGIERTDGKTKERRGGFLSLTGISEAKIILSTGKIGRTNRIL